MDNDFISVETHEYLRIPVPTRFNKQFQGSRSGDCRFSKSSIATCNQESLFSFLRGDKKQERYAGGSLPTLPRDLGNRLLDIAKLDDYQEPYQALKYAPYYSYSTVVMEMKDMMLNNKGTNINHSAFADGTLTSTNTYQRTKHFPNRNQYAIPFYIRSSFAISSAAVYANGAVDTSYDYAVPELGTVPLLNQEGTGGCVRTTTVSSTTSEKDSLFSKNSSHSTKAEDKKIKKRRASRYVVCARRVNGILVSDVYSFGLRLIRIQYSGWDDPNPKVLMSTSSPTQQEVLSALKRRLEQTSVPLFPRHRLRMLSKLAEGAFGTLQIRQVVAFDIRLIIEQNDDEWHNKVIPIYPQFTK
ncbi:hypothetical protein HZH68_010984 [Vespula germanica]|uniref:Uncharacterized protein n=1 Tax=Vespula germanica TaxID=30212 RepID=A0A834JTW0_VESGE|nr:hypothetical protein HZH68_010984 [Vespula germanica]